MNLKNLHYGWVMVIVAACILAAYAPVIYTFGIFLKPLTMEFDWDRGALSGAYSLKILITGLLAILAGRISDRYGPRLLVTISGLLIGVGFLLMSQVSSLWQVYLIWGVIFGVTGSCCFVPIPSAYCHWLRSGWNDFGTLGSMAHNFLWLAASLYYSGFNNLYNHRSPCPIDET